MMGGIMGVKNSEWQHNTPASWLAYCLCSLFVALQFVLQGSIGLMVPELNRTWNLSYEQIGWLSSAFFYPYVLMQVPSGRFINLWGLRKLMAISSLLIAMGCFVFAIAGQYGSALMGRLLMGFASAPGIVCLVEVITGRFSNRMIGYLLGAMEICGMMSAALGDYLIPLGVSLLGWRGMMLTFSGTALILSLLIWLCIKDVTFSTNNTVTAKTSHLTWKVLKDGSIWSMGIYSGLLFAVLNVFAAMWAVPFFSVAINYCNRECAAHLAGFIFVGASLGGLSLSIICSKWRALHYLTMALPAFTAIFLWISVHHADSYNSTLLTSLMLLLGFTSGGYLIPFILLKERFSCEKRAIAVGLTNMLSVMIGALILQPTIGFLLQHGSDENLLVVYQQSFVTLLAGLVIAFLIASYNYLRKGKNKIEYIDQKPEVIITVEVTSDTAENKKEDILQNSTSALM